MHLHEFVAKRNKRNRIADYVDDNLGIMINISTKWKNIKRRKKRSRTIHDFSRKVF